MKEVASKKQQAKSGLADAYCVLLTTYYSETGFSL